MFALLLLAALGQVDVLHSNAALPGSGNAAVIGASSPSDRWWNFSYLGRYEGLGGNRRFVYSKVRNQLVASGDPVDYGVETAKIETGIRGTDVELKKKIADALAQAHPVHEGPCPGPGPCPNPKPDRNPIPIPIPIEPLNPLMHWLPTILAGVLLVFTAFIAFVFIAIVAVVMRKPKTP